MRHSGCLGRLVAERPAPTASFRATGRAGRQGEWPPALPVQHQKGQSPTSSSTWARIIPAFLLCPLKVRKLLQAGERVRGSSRLPPQGGSDILVLVRAANRKGGTWTQEGWCELRPKDWQPIESRQHLLATAGQRSCEETGSELSASRRAGLPGLQVALSLLWLYLSQTRFRPELPFVLSETASQLLSSPNPPNAVCLSDRLQSWGSLWVSLASLQGWK